MTEPMDKTALLGRVLSEHARLEAALGGLRLDQFTEPGVSGAWSVKDILAHLSFWEQSMLQDYAAAARGERRPEATIEGETSEQVIDRQNDQAYLATRDHPLAAVLAGYGSSFGAVLAMLANLSDTGLAEGGPLAVALGGSVLGLIAGNTYEHYQEHAEAIRAWLARGVAIRR